MGTIWLLRTDGLFSDNPATWGITNYVKQQIDIFFSVWQEYIIEFPL